MRGQGFEIIGSRTGGTYKRIKDLSPEYNGKIIFQSQGTPLIFEKKKSRPKNSRMKTITVFLLLFFLPGNRQDDSVTIGKLFSEPFNNTINDPRIPEEFRQFVETFRFPWEIEDNVYSTNYKFVSDTILLGDIKVFGENNEYIPIRIMYNSVRKDVHILYEETSQPEHDTNKLVRILIYSLSGNLLCSIFSHYRETKNFLYSAYEIKDGKCEHKFFSYDLNRDRKIDYPRFKKRISDHSLKEYYKLIEEFQQANYNFKLSACHFPTSLELR
jgi:hypothetical protein